MNTTTDKGTEMNKTFSLNGTAYSTDSATLNILRIVIASARKSNDNSAVIAVLTLGQMAGRIVAR